MTARIEGPHKKGGRKPFVPTDEQRKLVESMAACGITQEQIADVIGVHEATLKRKFRDELHTSATKANAKVARTLFTMATSGKVPAATIFWCKARLRWTEPKPYEDAPAGAATATGDTVIRRTAPDGSTVVVTVATP